MPTDEQGHGAAEAPSAKVKLAYFAALLGLVAIPYGQVVDAFFVADDYNILSIVQPAQSLEEATGIAAGWEFFRPLTALTYWVTCWCCGLEPIAFHTFDLLLHATNAFLVAQLAWLLRPNRIGAAFAGASFTLLPANVECVTWIAGRFDVLCVTGTLLSVTGLLRYLATPPERKLAVRALSRVLIGLAIALFAKDTGMIVPFILLFLCATAGRITPAPRPIGRRLPVIGAVAVLFAGYLALRLYVLGGFGGYRSAGGNSHLQIDFGCAFGFLRDGLRLLVAPGSSMLLSLATFGLVAYLAVRMIGDRHGSAAERYGWLWTVAGGALISLLPAANTVVLHVSTGENSRFLYLPAGFFCAGLGIVFGRFSSTRAGRVAGLLLLLSYGITATRSNANWREAGRQAETILVQLQEHAADRNYEHLFIYGLPDNYRGAYVFRNGFEAAVRMFVGKKPRFPPHGRLSKADWERSASLRRAQPKVHPGVLLLRWDATRKHLTGP